MRIPVFVCGCFYLGPTHGSIRVLFSWGLFHKAFIWLGLCVLLVFVLEPSRKPLNVLAKLLNCYVAIVLKSGAEYRGTVVRCDGYMNVLLESAVERFKDELVANYGRVLVRGNNVLYIRTDVPKKK